MKNNLLATAFSTLLIASSTFVISEEVLANKTLISRTITTPSITISTVSDENFIIELSPSSLFIKDLEITLPQQISYLEGISITDESGQEVKADIQKNKDKVLITFSESIKPGNTLKVEFADVDTQSTMGETLFYKLSVQKEGLLQRIPIGTARFDVPDAS
ncbi:MAG: hypothetical protein AAFW70_05540 [Cyanobacteria bacterium J06635_10]